MNKSSMSKQMGNYPKDKDKARQAKLDKDSSPEGARKAGKKKFFEMYEDDGRTPKNKEKEVKGMKKMNMGGMTSPMMGASGAPQSGPKKPMMPPKPKPAPRAPYDDSDMGNGPKPKVIVDPAKKSPKPRMKSPMGKGGDMPRMKKGGKVRGYGMARGGKACKMR